MNMQEQYSAARAKLEASRLQERDLHMQVQNLESEVEKLAIQLMLEKGLFTQSDWFLQVKDYSSWYEITLTARRNHLHKEIVEMLDPDHHGRYNIEPGVSLSIDHGDVYMRFDTMVKAVSFINTHKIVPKISKVMEDIKRAQDIADGLRTVVELLPNGDSK